MVKSFTANRTNMEKKRYNIASNHWISINCGLTGRGEHQSGKSKEPLSVSSKKQPVAAQHKYYWYACMLPRCFTTRWCKAVRERRKRYD